MKNEECKMNFTLLMEGVIIIHHSEQSDYSSFIILHSSLMTFFPKNKKGAKTNLNSLIDCSEKGT